MVIQETPLPEHMSSKPRQDMERQQAVLDRCYLWRLGMCGAALDRTC